MKLLVACPSRILLVDTEDRSVAVVEDSAPEYYGVSWTPDGRDLCVAHSGIEIASLDTFDDYADTERGWLTVGGRRSSPCLSLAHQVHCLERHVLVTNTQRNCLTVFRTEDLYFHHHWFDSVRWDRRGRRNHCGSHFNSLAVRDGRLYVLAHNFDRPSYVLVLSWPGLEVIERIDCPVGHTHNVWPTADGRVIVCDSLHGRLIEAASGETVWPCGDPNAFTRGLACHGNYLFVGKSAQSAPSARLTSDGGVWVLDRDSWRVLDFIPLPGSGVVNEVRLVDVPDECHHLRPLVRLPEPDAAATERYLAAAGAAGRRAAAGPMAPARVASLPFEEPFAAGDRPPGAEWVTARGAFRDSAGRLTPVVGDISVAVLGGVADDDVAVSASVELPPGPHRYAGVAARYAGPGDANMVLGTLVAREDAVTADLWEHDGGDWRLLASALAGRRRGVLRLEAAGRQLRLRLDGELVCEALQKGEPKRGSVGVRGVGGRYRDFKAEHFESAPAPAPEPLHVGIWCDFGQTLVPYEGIGVFVHSLARGLLARPEPVTLTLVAHLGEQEVMDDLRAVAPERVRVLPEKGPHPRYRHAAFWLLWQWLRGSSELRRLLASARACLERWLARPKTSGKDAIKGLARRGLPGLALVACAAAASALPLWAAFGTGRLLLAVAEVAVFPAALADRLARRFWVNARLFGTDSYRELIRSAGCDVWLVPYVGFEYPIDFPAVVVVHDLVVFHFPEMFEPRFVERLREVVHRRGREATLCACMSDFIKKNDLEGVLGLSPDKVRMIRPAAPADLPRMDKVESAERRPPFLRRPYLFLPSAFRGYKNHARLIEALDLLRRDFGEDRFDLVFTGRIFHELPTPLADLARRLGVRNRIHVLGRVDRLTLAALYHEAFATVMPSLYEQGSFPVYEALLCGCPVACSDIPSLREQCAAMGDAMLYFDPGDAAAIARAVLAIRDDRERIRQRQREASKPLWDRTWEMAAAEWLKVLREAATARPEAEGEPMLLRFEQRRRGAA